MFKTVAHYYKRSRELGFLGTFRQAQLRTMNPLALWFESLWWGRKARKEMSDLALLRRTTGSYRSVADLLEHLASRPATSYLLPHESAQVTASCLNQHYSQYVSAVIASADAACQNELSLLGRVFHFSPFIDWHCDPDTGWRWPLLHRNRMGKYLYTLMHPADPIILWELNRHQHFVTLGIAYWLTSDQCYVDAFCSQIQDWIETNPIQHGINWYYPLEVSIRLIVWTAAFQFFRNAPKFRKKTGKIFLKSLWQQVDFLSHHIQITRSEVPNNHMIAELTGLVLVGIAFPEFRKSTDWRETGLRLLDQEAAFQTHPDGANKEQATGYHRFITELLLLLVACSRQGKLQQVPTLEKTLVGMLEYILFSLTPVGMAPMWGDSDYGRALGIGLNKDFWDFRPLLSAGAVLFGRPDWKKLAGRFDEEAFWLLGSDGLHLWDQLDIRPPDQVSRSFPDAGMYIIRDRWTSDTDVAFFRCGPFGLGGEGHCAHAHCDLLSLVLWVNGQPLLVDSGTYTYHGSWRDHFRLTAAHNTVMVDGCDQAVPIPNFNWRQTPEAKCIDWSENSVTGALKYSNQVEFVRKLAHPKPNVWELTDSFSGNGDLRKLSWFFHFALNLVLIDDDTSGNINVLKYGKPYVVVIPPKGVQVEIESSWYSYSYGYKEPNPILRASWEGEIPSNNIIFFWKFVTIETIQ